MSEATMKAVAAAVVLVVFGICGCSTGPDARSDRDSGPDEVVGSPPEEGSEEYEFAAPPRHPGRHGDVADRGEASPETSGDSEDGVTRDDVDRLRNFGPSVILEHVRLEPSHDDDGFVGFEIVEMSPSAARYAEPDLVRGDVVTHVNLVRLEKPDDYMEAWETLEDAREIRIDFKRDGEDQSLSWPVE